MYNVRQIYRAYPYKATQAELNQNIGNARFVWNYFLNLIIEKYKSEGKFIFYNDLSKLLTELKKQPEFDWLKLSESTTLQQKLRDLDKAIKQSTSKKYVNKKGFPKFKSRKTDESGIRFVGNIKLLDENHIKLPKISQPIKVKFHRPLLGKPTSATIIKDRVGNWFVSFVVQVDGNFIELNKDEVETAAGIDLGCKTFAVCSDGISYDSPKLLHKSEKKLKKLQKKHSKKQKNSNNKEKSRRRLAKQHKKVSNQRSNFIKQTASSIAKKNDLVVCEDLNVSGLLKNHKLAKTIGDCSLGAFLRELQWQCKKRGKIFHQVDRWYPSSKTCNCCGYIKKELKLSERGWICPQCGSIIDRDYNASLNILQQGLKDLEIRQELPKLTPVTRGNSGTKRKLQ